MVAWTVDFSKFLGNPADSNKFLLEKLMVFYCPDTQKESLILFAIPHSNKSREYIIPFATGDFKSRTCIKILLKRCFNHFTYGKITDTYSLYFKTEVGSGASANLRTESLEEPGPRSNPRTPPQAP